MKGVKERVEEREREEVNTDEEEVKERPEIVHGAWERSHPCYTSFIADSESFFGYSA